MNGLGYVVRIFVSGQYGILNILTLFSPRLTTKPRFAS